MSARNLAPLRSSRVPLESLLLPPRSALRAARRRPAAPLRRSPHAPLHSAARRWRGLGRALSAIHFQGRSIRQVSRDTLLSGCRRSWPPPCCLDGPTPFVVSVCAHSGTLPARPVHPASPVLLTKNGPLGARIRARVRRATRALPIQSLRIG